MLVFILRRLAQAVIVMLTVAFLAFMLFQYVGDPVTNLLGQEATAEQREQLRRDLGLDQPFPVQFGTFVGNAMQGEFGFPSVFRLSDPEETDVAMRMYHVHGTPVDSLLKLLGYKPMQRCMFIGSADGSRRSARRRSSARRPSSAPTTS